MADLENTTDAFRAAYEAALEEDEFRYACEDAAIELNRAADIFKEHLGVSDEDNSRIPDFLSTAINLFIEEGY